MFPRKLNLTVPALLVLFTLGCGGSSNSSNGGGGGSALKVSMTSQMTFSPVTIDADPGDTVKWTNNDTTNHTVTPDVQNSGMTGSDGTFPNGVAPGGTFTFNVPMDAQPGAKFFYHCRFHGAAGDGNSLGTGMAGLIQINGGGTQTHNVGMPGMAFSPVTVHVNPGDKVKWKNGDTSPHTVTGDVSSQGLSSDGQYPNGMSHNDVFTFTVPNDTASGTVFYYHCRFHGTAGDGTSLGTGMAGSVVVD